MIGRLYLDNRWYLESSLGTSDYTRNSYHIIYWNIHIEKTIRFLNLVKSQMKAVKIKQNINKFFIIFTFILSIATIGLGLGISIEEAYLQITTGGKIERSIWFVHPTTDQTPVAVIQDHYIAKDSSEQFTLVVHGLGEMNVTSRGAVWQLPTGAMQVEMLAEIDSIEEASGYNAETGQFEPYIKIIMKEKGETYATWLAIGIENATNPCPVDVISTTEILVNNTLKLYIPEKNGDPLAINTTYHANPDFTFTGDMLIERNGSGAFVAGANIANVTGGTPIDVVETFEWIAGDGKWLQETETLEQQQAETRNVISIPTETALQQLLNALPVHSPYLFANSSELAAFQEKYNESRGDIYGDLTSSLKSRANTAMDYVFDDITIENVMKRSSRALDLAFDAWLTANATKAGNVVMFLKLIHDHIDRIDEDPKYLHHGINLANYVLAWDFIEPLISSANNSIVREEIEDYAHFVAKYLPGSNPNNWELVVSSGVGLAGLKLKDAAMIRATLEKTDHYLSENVKLEGGIYEGQGYIGYAFTSHKRFLMVLSRYAQLGYNSPDYFSDARLQAVYRFSARCATPDGYYPLFEDAGTGTSGAINAMLLAPFFARSGGITGEQLASELMWLYFKHYSNTSIPSPIEHFLFANHSINPKVPELDGKVEPHPEYNGYSYVAPESGLAMFRTGWGENASYLTTTAKTYSQSHVHWDELCFEFWVNGTKHLTMPGYPGWGNDYHSWTTTTEASNGAILFDGDGQTQDHCKTGIVQWIRGRHVDYIEMVGDGLYTKHNFLLGGDYLWVLPIGFGICGIIVFLDIIGWKKMKIKKLNSKNSKQFIHLIIFL